MARKTPHYRLHKPSGRAVLQWKPLERLIGKAEIYLDGTYGSRECVEHFARILKLLEDAKPMSPAELRAVKSDGLCIADLVLEYKKAKAGSPEKKNLYRAVDYLNAACGADRIEDFGPLAFQKFRNSLVTPQRSVNYINKLARRILRAFKWGVPREMVAAEHYAALSLIENLKPGETAARVTKKVRPVAWADVQPVLAKLTPMVAAMVQVHGLAGMRSSELTGLKESELDRSGAVWIYRKADHKTAHRGKEKIICFGPRAQALLTPYLDRGNEFVFSPKIAEQERKSARAASRKTPIYGKAKTNKPSFQSTRNRYDSRTYRRTLYYAFVTLANERMKSKEPGVKYVRQTPPKGADLRAWLMARDVTYFHPHQLRHARATDTAEAFGVEAASTQLGNTLTATQLYAERSLRIAIEIAGQTG